TFIASVDPPQATGTITFMQGQTALGTAPLNGGQASFTTSSLAAGDLSITAVYSGDQQYAASTSRELKQTVQ
ncbi:MAG TPA: Ig-like domain-containing protein, partial [Bryobacteraceae bacterium]